MPSLLLAEGISGGGEKLWGSYWISYSSWAKYNI